MRVEGELWRDPPSRHFVRAGTHFHPLATRLIPPGAREYDRIAVLLDEHGGVVRVLSHTPDPILRRPVGFRPPPGVHVGRVTEYDGRVGRLDGRVLFDTLVVKALDGGEVAVNEIVEYTMDGGVVTHVTGSFGTHVSQCGRPLSATPRASGRLGGRTKK